MINQISIKNFKSYNSAVLKLAPLTLLIGANASGKSNAIEAIRFLSWLAEGRRLDDIQQINNNIRGTLGDLTNGQSKSDIITLGCELSNTGEWKKFSIAISVKAQSDDEMRVVKESVTSKNSKVPLYHIKESVQGYSHEVQVAYNNFAKGGKKPTIPCTDKQAVFTQLDVPSRFAKTTMPKKPQPREVIPDVVTKLRQALRKILFLDPIPRHMAAYSYIDDKDLKGDGENISSVLYNLCMEQNRKNSVLEFIQFLPEQDIVNIDFIKTPRNEVMIQLVESFGNQTVKRDAPLLSDGTLRVLAVTAALLSASKGSLIIIEEIDNGIHPSRAGKLLNKIQEVAEKRDLRVLLTSHNPALLDTLPNRAIPDVVACYRDSEYGDSQLTRLEDLANYPEITARGPLGQLMTTGILARYLESQQTPDEKKAQSLQWLKSLRESMEEVT